MRIVAKQKLNRRACQRSSHEHRTGASPRNRMPNCGTFALAADAISLWFHALLSVRDCGTTGFPPPFRLSQWSRSRRGEEADSYVCGWHGRVRLLMSAATSSSFLQSKQTEKALQFACDFGIKFLRAGAEALQRRSMIRPQHRSRGVTAQAELKRPAPAEKAGGRPSGRSQTVSVKRHMPSFVAKNQRAHGFQGGNP